MFFSKKDKGNLGESAAAAELVRIGYKILERNYHVQGGEIDIIAIDEDVLAVVEVKMRSSAQYGLPEEAVNRSKVRKTLRAVMKYVSDNQLMEMPIRFDIVSVLLNTNNEFEISVIKNAISFEDYQEMSW